MNAPITLKVMEAIFFYDRKGDWISHTPFHYLPALQAFPQTCGQHYMLGGNSPPLAVMHPLSALPSRAPMR